MSFPWLQSSAGSRDGAARRLAAAQTELRERAAMLQRLGFPAKQATQRLLANLAWDFETAPRPAGLDDAAVKKLVDEIYQRQRT